MIPPKEFFRKIKPFSFLSEEHLSALVGGLDVAMYAAGTVVCAKDEVSPSVFLVFSGLVGLYDSDELVDLVSKGEIFGLLSAMHHTPSYYEARALEDSICYLIDAEAFERVYRAHSAFASFFTTFIERRFRSFSQLAREQESLQDGATAVLVEALVSKAPVTCRPDQTVKEAVGIMDTHGVGSVVVVQDGKPVGILTNRDMRRVLLLGNPDSAVNEFMSAPVITVDCRSSVLEAYTVLLRTGIDHLVVMDQDRLHGVITSKDVLAQLEPSSSILAIYRKILKAVDLEELKSAFHAIRVAVSEMALKGIHFYQLSRMLTTVYDTVVIRVIQRHTSPMEGQDFLWVHVGSSGRKEQILTTDQDNAVLCSATGPCLAAAQDITRILEELGIPRCPADYMASNPRWHLSLEEWKEHFRRWFLEPIPEHIRYLTVFLDMRAVYGNLEWLGELIDAIHNAITNQAVRFLAYDAALHEPPIGIFGIRHRDRGVDVKRYGIYPIANGVRVMIAANRMLRITNTRERIEALRDAGVLSQESAGDLLEAYAFLQDLRLRHQAWAMKHGSPEANLLMPDKLDKMDLLVLKESLKVVASFQKNLKALYGVDRGL
ncbi:MAG: putative nucleotidyltransferase substrate binding domain-containing protein [Desulfosoma sp.]|uniref:putative nucleotidyltransferase substrate binding domain-containing protein n=1 Tax=Desulfosoma sp. TaxID=2603217 RepID=UPI00404B7F96